jgi:hypothetical protein
MMRSASSLPHSYGFWPGKLTNTEETAFNILRSTPWNFSMRSQLQNNENRMSFQSFQPSTKTTEKLCESWKFSRVAQPQGYRGSRLLEERKLNSGPGIELFQWNGSPTEIPILSRGSAHTPHPSTFGREQPCATTFFHQLNALKRTGVKAYPRSHPSLSHGLGYLSSTLSYIRSTGSSSQKKLGSCSTILLC